MGMFLKLWNCIFAASVLGIKQKKEKHEDCNI